MPGADDTLEFIFFVLSGRRFAYLSIIDKDFQHDGEVFC